MAECRHLFYLEFYFANTANQTFVTVTGTSRFFNDFFEFMTVCGNNGVFALYHVFTIFKLVIHIVIPIIVISDITVARASRSDRFDLIQLSRSEIIKSYRFDYCGTVSFILPEFNGIGIDVVYKNRHFIIFIVIRRYLTFVGVSGIGVIITPTNVKDCLYDNGSIFGGNYNTAAGISTVFVKSWFSAIDIGDSARIIGY